MDVERRQAPAPTAGGQLGAGREGGGPDAVTWRLVGANNHELGRSPYVHHTLTACGAAVERLQGRLEEVTTLVAMSTGTGPAAAPAVGTAKAAGPGSAAGSAAGSGSGSATGSGSGIGAWTWQLALDESCVAVAVRTFRRQRECRHSLQLFLSAAAEAQVASGVTYTRRLRGLRLPGADDAPGLALRGGGLR
ncbi:hypothetical protein ACODT3_33085 [Streptomyces sp. 4.24]|uniref:hypothetical protein n=1 Tax=Streptomyces tritrimontium TaxID=3406573 RepID=UPI003BB6EFD1